MSNSGGNPRFKGSGSQWKSSWAGSVPYTEMCCVEGFVSDLGTDPPLLRYYVSTVDNVLELDPARGFLLGALVMVSEPPFGKSIIASNGDGLTEGWIFSMIDVSPSAEEPQVAFLFEVFGAAGLVADDQSDPISLEAVVPGFGIPSKLAIRTMAVFIPTPAGLGNGTAICLPGGSSQALVTPYANGDHPLTVGLGSGGTFELPNCLHGIVGAEAPGLEFFSEAVEIYDAWREAIDTSYQLEPIPSTTVEVTNLDGWRQEGPAGTPPDPWEPFVGSDDLVLIGALTVACNSPTVFEAEFVVDV